MRRTVALLILIATASLPGCSAIVRNSVDTQPRVALTDSAFQLPDEIVGGEAIAFAPPAQGAGLDPDLLRHAPIVVQGFQPARAKRRYDREADAIGAPRLAADGAHVTVDTARPEVYARVETAAVNGTQVKELVYAFWYPSRPVGSIEKGSVDGGVLRITLDTAGRPAVFEYTQPCGCFHGVFVSADLEAAAQAEFEIVPQRMHAVEPPLEESDWVVRDLVEVRDDARPVLYMSAGRHFCEAIRYVDPRHLATTVHQQRGYGLRPYEDLEHAPREGGGIGSIFNDKGLVHGGKRWGEEIALADLDSPGWPRHLDRMLVHWDTARWTDPTLLEDHLRLPQGMTGGAAAPRPAMAQRAVIDADTPLAGDDQELVLFTNRYCTGCIEAKQMIAESAAVRDAMHGWSYRVVDTATPDGARLAAAYRVTLVPSLVAIDHGRELFRSEDIDTPDKVVAVMSRHEQQ